MDGVMRILLPAVNFYGYGRVASLLLWTTYATNRFTNRLDPATTVTLNNNNQKKKSPYSSPPLASDSATPVPLLSSSSPPAQPLEDMVSFSGSSLSSRSRPNLSTETPLRTKSSFFKSVIQTFYLIFVILVCLSSLPFEAVEAIPMSTKTVVDSLVIKNSSDSVPEPQPLDSCSRPDQEFVSPMHGSPHCCTKCVKGDGMLSLCTDRNDTECRACKAGAEFSPRDSAMDKCLQCSQCSQLDPNALVKDACTPIRDTVCKCVPGNYFADDQTCKKCTKCPPGLGVKQLCSWNSDAVCVKCSIGFYSDLTSALSRCKRCSMCSAVGLIQVSPCTDRADTVCCPPNKPDCAKTDPKRPSSQTLGSANGTKNSLNVRPQKDWRKYIVVQNPGKFPAGNSSDNSEVDGSPTIFPYGQAAGNELIPLYCAIMGLVIVGLVVYVVYKYWRQRQAGTAGKLGGTGVGFAGLPTKASSKHQGNTRPQEQPLLRVVPVCSSVDAQRKNPTLCRPEERMYRDLPDKHRSRIESCLAEKKQGAGWKELSHELGYAQAEISAYESGDAMVTTTIRKILNDWAARDTATLSELSRALTAVGQQDVLSLIYPGSGGIDIANANGNKPGTVCKNMGHV